MRTLCLQPEKKIKWKWAETSIHQSLRCAKSFLFLFFFFLCSFSSHLMSFVWKTYEASQREHIHGGERSTDG